MAAQKSIDDCYFYYYSSCTKGDMCPFRHCELALGTETVCSLWKEGMCFKNNCKFRHMESRINRAKIPCYWENQPGGCRKPHCVFFHRKLKNGASSAKENSGLILPLSNGSPRSNSPKSPEEADLAPSPRSSPRLDILSEFVPDSTSVPVTPIVVSFDEESDNESVSSTPVKMSTDSVGPDQVGFAKSNLLSKLSEASEKKDFGVKTLEQIRMEKIHKESEHFYKSDDLLGNGIPKLGLKSSRNATLLNDTIFCYSEYDAPALTASQKTQKMNECYPPKSEFLSVSAPADASNDKNLYVSTQETSPQGLEPESYLRGRLSKRSSFLFPKVASDKRVINFKKQNNKSEVSSDSLNFKIKTLDEIRRERESKQGTKEDGSISCDNTSSNSVQENILKQGLGQKSTKRLKITRQPTELQTQSISNTKGGGDSTLTNSSMETETRSQMVLHEVQANNQTQLKESSSDRTTVALGKRKVTEDAELEIKNKMPKRDTEESKNETILLNGINAPEKQAVTGLWSFLRRPLTKSPERTTILSKPLDDVDTSVVPSDVPETSHPQDTPSEPKEAEMETSNEDCSISSTTVEDDHKTPSAQSEEEKPRSKSLSVDEFDNFLIEADMNMEEVDDTESAGGDDILLEIEQFLDS